MALISLETRRGLTLADPKLVAELIRPVRKGQRDRTVTPERIARVAIILPGEEHFGAQEAVLNAAAERKLTLPQTARLAQGVKVQIEPGISFEDAFRVAMATELPTTRRRAGEKDVDAKPGEKATVTGDATKAQRERKPVAKSNTEDKAAVDIITQSKAPRRRSTRREETADADGQRSAPASDSKGTVIVDVGRLEEENGGLKAEPASDQKRTDGLEQTNSDLSGDLDPTKAGLAAAQKRIGELVRRDRYRREELERVKGELAATQTELGRTRRALATAKEKIKKTNSRQPEADAKATDGPTQQADKGDQRIAELEKENAELRAQLEAAAETTGAWYLNPDIRLTPFEQTVASIFCETGGRLGGIIQEVGQDRVRDALKNAYDKKRAHARSNPTLDRR